MIILLNGCINAGKTTVAQAIIARSIGFAHIEVDVLRHFISWMPLENTVELSLKNAVAVAKNFHEQNISSIISYPLNKGDLNFVKNLLSDSFIDLHVITLYPGFDKLKTNRGNRELSQSELRRIDALHQMGIANPSFGVVIDNSAQTVEQTADDVLKIVGC